MAHVMIIFALGLLGTTAAYSGNHESCGAHAADKTATKTEVSTSNTANDAKTHSCSCGADCSCHTGEKACDCGCAGNCDKT